MNSLIIMGIIVILLMTELAYGAKFNSSPAHFFDLNNTKAMRGFWCFIVILVHIPRTFQNPIQDMIGSFGFIGVTFFFMTSGYGLTLSVMNKPELIKFFWRRHLPKLLVTNWIVNLVSISFNKFLYGAELSLKSIFAIDVWIQWLFGCYFLFWLTQTIFAKNRKKGLIIGAAAIALLSFGFYLLRKTGIITSTVWDVECLGFVWGIILAYYYGKIVGMINRNWIRNIAASFVVSLVLGTAYLKFKAVPFAGDYILKVLLGLAITAFILIINVKVNIGNRISLFLGDISYEIYLVQWETFLLVTVLLGEVSSGVFILTSLAIAVILAAICHYITKPVLSGIDKILFSGKEK